MKKPKTQNTFRELRTQLEQLEHEVRPSLDALEEFVSPNCCSQVYKDICAGYSHTHTRETWTADEDGGDTETDTTVTHFTLDNARQYANALTSHYQAPLDQLRASFDALRTHFEEAGVHISEA